MADKKITALTALGATDVAPAADLLHIIDYSASPVNKNITVANLFSNVNTDTHIYGISKTFEIGSTTSASSAIKVTTGSNETLSAAAGRTNEVIVNDNFILSEDELTLQNKKKISDWQSLGVRRMDGSDLPKKNIEGYLIKIKDTNKERYFLVYQNFKKILKWNTSNYFAIAVGILSDSININ